MRERFKASVSVFSVVRDDDNVLMILRSNTGWMDGHWSLPAGALDGGEVASHAAARELVEEVCLRADPSALRLGHTQHNFTHGDEWIGLYFEAKAVDGEARIGEPHKHGDLRWFNVHDLPQNTVPYVRQALNRMLASESFSVYSDQ